MRKFIALVMSCVLTFTLAVPALAVEVEPLSPQILSDTSSERTVTVDDATATYYKDSNTVTVTQDGQSATFSLDPIENASLPSLQSNKTIIRDETVWMHEYEYYKTSNTSFYWTIDIPSLNINPSEWCDPITVSDNGSKAAKACSSFASYIDDAKENEVDLLAYGGAIAVSAAIGFISKNMKFTKAAYIAACAAAGITVTSNVAGIAGDYINNILNSRDEYYAVQGYVS